MEYQDKFTSADRSGLIPIWPGLAEFFLSDAFYFFLQKIRTIAVLSQLTNKQTINHQWPILAFPTKIIP